MTARKPASASPERLLRTPAEIWAAGYAAGTTDTMTPAMRDKIAGLIAIPVAQIRAARDTRDGEDGTIRGRGDSSGPAPIRKHA